VLDDLRDALRSEYGARSVYPLLVRFARDEDLRNLLRALAEEECAQVEAVRALIDGMGVRAARRSVRRVVMAWILFLSTPVVGLRFALRLCHDAEARVARWYHGFAAWFAEMGDGKRARMCQELSSVKRRHAQALEAFVLHSPGRWGRR
jgi:hypothetical protein